MKIMSPEEKSTQSEKKNHSYSFYLNKGILKIYSVLVRAPHQNGNHSEILSSNKILVFDFCFYLCIYFAF